jgi:hypothetical protein
VKTSQSFIADKVRNRLPHQALIQKTELFHAANHEVGAASKSIGQIEQIPII